MALGHAQFGWYRTEFQVRAFSILVLMYEIVYGSMLSKFLSHTLSTFIRSILPIVTSSDLLPLIFTSHRILKAPFAHCGK